MNLRRLLLPAALAAALVPAAAVHAQGAAAAEIVIPGVGAARLVEVQVEVMAIDPANRVLTVRGPSGRSYSLEVDPAVQRFGEVRTGDWVKLGYYEALAVALRKGPGIRQRSETVSAGASPAGAAPAAGAARIVTVVSDVWSIDSAKQTVHVRGPRGHVVEVKLRDPALLQGVAVGDQVELTYAVGGVVRLEPGAAPKS